MSLYETIILVLLAFCISKIPVIGKYVAVLNTLFHEIGHAIFALLFQGRVQSISLFSNTSGLAMTYSRSWVGQVITSLAGYPTASLTAFCCFFMIHHHYTHYVLYGFIGASIFALLFWIRNIYGWIWGLSFLFLCGTLILKGSLNLQNQVTVFLSGVILTQSIFSSITIFWISMTSPKNAGDATNLARATWIPAIVWGLFFMVQSVYFGYLTFKWYIL